MLNKIEKFENGQRIVQELRQIIDEDEQSVMEAIIEYSNVNDFEIEFLAEVVKTSDYLTSKLQEEAESLNLMKTKISRLPL